jgi:hypothetical protein
MVGSIARVTSHNALVVTVVLLFALPISLWGQGTIVTGSVTDPSGAVISAANVELRNAATNATLTTKTNGAGAYIFNSVPPGNYNLTITAAGFSKYVSRFDVNIGRNATANAKLQVGTTGQTVEVTAGASAELQTMDASVGDVVNQEALDRLPSLSRDATAILLLQPMSAPGFGAESNTTGGQVAGARSDQNTFILDGGDATSNTEGGGGYANQAGAGFAAEARGSVPTPTESLEEFRVITNSSNTFARSAGGEVQMVTRRGTNTWHGGVYEYNQNTDYNANTWQLNHADLPRGIWIDNRFGARVGGPIIKDKAFFFTMFEGRRFKKAAQISRLVPSTLFKQGIMQFKDASGVVRQYNLRTSTLCAGGACDPRGLGLSPTISKIWDFMPTGTDTSQGDGLNTIGFVSSVPLITNENVAVSRFDYKLSNNWDLNSSFRYAVSDGVGAGQVDIGGILPGDTKGVPTATRTLPTQPRFLTVGLTGRLTSNMTNDFHFSYLRHWWKWAPKSPFPQVPGLGAAVQISAESAGSGLVPINIDTQNARSRVWNGKDYTINDGIAWVKGNHFFQLGGEVRRQHFFHDRDDKVVGALTSPVYFATRGSDIAIPAANRPPTCGAVTTNCLTAGDVGRWNNLYPAVLGMISRGSQLLTRKSDFSPNPAGTPLTQDSIIYWYNLHFTDSWKVTPSFTVSYGLGWGEQTPPYETTGQQTIMIDNATKKPVIFSEYLQNLAANAAQGKPYAPVLGFAPIKSLGRKYPYDPEYSNFDPRVSFAWNPSFGDGWMGQIFGDKKSVLRGGYGRFHDRLNGVGIVMTPALGIGFGNTVTCRRVINTGACGSGSTTGPANAFRIGVDGNSITFPSLAAVSGALVPGNDAGTPGANSPYEILDFRIDPKRRVGVEDTWNLNIQRELPGRMLLEVGYVGRTAHHLYSAQDLNQVPYMWSAGGQTFAQAFDAVAAVVRANPNAAVPKQPWFETMLAGHCAGFTSCTSMVAANELSNFQDGIVGLLWDDVMAGTLGINTSPFDQQFSDEQISTSNQNSNYHAGYVSVRKQTTHGFTFQVNYTLAHAIDTIGVNQENVFISPSDSFKKERDYGPSYFDRRHTLNLFFLYDLPFGKGRLFSTNNRVLDKIFGGWGVSGAFTAASGLPLDAINGASCEEFGSSIDFTAFCSAMIPTKGSLKAKTLYNADGTVQSFTGKPDDVAASYRRLFFSDQRTGRGAIRGFGRWNMDATVDKEISITERVRTRFTVQAVNVFNHMQFADPGTDISNPSQFGVVSTQYGSPRFLSIGLKFDF